MIGNTGKQGKEKTKPLLTLGKARNCTRKVIRIQYMAQLWIMFMCSYNVYCIYQMLINRKEHRVEAAKEIGRAVV